MVMQAVLGLLDDEITLEAWIGQDRYGKGTYGEAKVVRSRVEQGQHEVAGPTGQAIVGRFKVILGEAVLADPRDRLTLPKQYGARVAGGAVVSPQPAILSVRQVYYRGKADHTVLVCG